jgi:hypothetical protein
VVEAGAYLAGYRNLLEEVAHLADTLRAEVAVRPEEQHAI